MTPLLYFGQVMHQRLVPLRHGFSYPLFFLRAPVADLASLRRPLFSLDRWNLMSFHQRDHGARDGSSLETWMRGLLRQNGLAHVDGEIVLHTFPRMLGYVFNPVSFWLCHDRDGGLRCVLAEVANTFGENHSYLLVHEDGRIIAPGDTLTASKAFHVSPFFPVSGNYRFQVDSLDGRSRMRIDYRDGEQLVLATCIQGEGRAYTTGNLLRAFFGYPWQSLGTMIRIHWQALHLWRKGVPFFPKPNPPAEEISVERT